MARSHIVDEMVDWMEEKMAQEVMLYLQLNDKCKELGIPEGDPSKENILMVLDRVVGEMIERGPHS